MRKDKDLYNAVDAIGFHYTTGTADTTTDYITMADQKAQGVPRTFLQGWPDRATENCEVAQQNQKQQLNFRNSIMLLWYIDQVNIVLNMRVKELHTAQ